MHQYVYIVIVYIYIYILYIKIKTKQFCISFKICSVILSLLLLTYEHIYNVTYNKVRAAYYR